jgi:cytochrome c oxidase subunit 4
MDRQAMTHHVVPLRVYFAVFAALIILTAVTIQVAYLDMGNLNTPAALGIASVKALLVTLYFMHVRYSSRLIWLTAAAGVIWLGFLILITLTDYLSRGWLPFPGK